MGVLKGGAGRRVVTGSLVVGMLLGVLPAGASAVAAQGDARLVAREVRTVDAKDFGASRPGGVAYDPARREFLVVAAGTDGTPVHRLDFLWETAGVVTIPTVGHPASLAFDAASDRLTWIADGRLVGVPAAALRSSTRITQVESLGEVDVASPAGVTIDSESGDVFVLDADSINRLSVDGSEEQLATSADSLIAHNPSDGYLYVLDTDADRLEALDDEGAIVATYDTSSVDFSSPQAMTFAPSTDSTDDPDILNLFVADAGDETWDGGVTEMTLEQPVLLTTAETVDASLIQVIDASAWNPPAMEPSGIVWTPSNDRLIVVDSEINEISSVFQGVNMWHINRSGTVLDTGATWGPNSANSYSDEPTGLGYDNATNTLFISDDTGTRSVYVVKPGPDGRFGTTDDQVVQINMTAYGATDTEDPEFDPVTGHLFVLSGTDREIFRIDPVDGIFGNGNDIVTSFDISHLGPTDFEGMTSSVGRRTLFVGARSTGQIFEITHDGQLVRTINVNISGNRFISGLAMAPSSTNPSVKSLWIVDRGVADTLDGKIFEIAVPDLDSPVGNLPPVVDAGADQTVAFPNAATLSGSVTDDGNPEGSVLTHTWSKQVGPGDVTFGNPNALSTTATFSSVGVYVLDLTASDGELTSSDTLIVTVEAPPNSAPTIEPIDDVSVPEGGTVVVDVSVSDADGDELTITTDDLPAFASFNPTTRQITISPQAGDSGLYGPVTVTVSDGDAGGGQVPAFRSATSALITGINDSVLTIARPAGVEAGDLLIAQIRYRDSSSGGANLTPPTGWTVLHTIVRSQANHTVLYKIAGANEPVQYSFDQNATSGRISGGIGAYIGADLTNPIHAWAASAPDLAALTAPAVTTTVDNTRIIRLWGWRGSQATDSGVGFNLPPAGITQRWSEQVGHSNTDRNRVLAGDHVQLPAGSVGTATASGSSSSGENRRSAFTIALAPGAVGASASTTFNITVTEGEPGNSPPVAQNDTATTAEGEWVDIDVLANDSDPNGDPLTVVLASQPANGTAVVNANQTVRYTPAAGFSGQDSFTYRASDGSLTSNLATVTVMVSFVNSPPVAQNDTASTPMGTAVDIAVLANDSDPDGDPLTVVLASQPANGTAVVNANQTVLYTPAAGFSGQDSFTYRASDGSLTSNLATVTITVTFVNSPPVAQNDTATMAEGEWVDIDVLANDSDPDGDPLTVVLVSQPANGTAVVNANQTVLYTPAAGFSGQDSFTYRAFDGHDQSNLATVTITVHPDLSVLDQYPTSQLTTFGSVSGGLENLLASDNVYQQLTEESTGGRPNTRVSRLEHRWFFNIERGETITFLLEARRSANSEGDNFAFTYSADGGATFHPLVVVSATSDTNYAVNLPNTTSGQVIVRVVDTDRTVGNGSADSLFVDRMLIRSDDPLPALPTVTVSATEPLASEYGDEGEFTITRSSSSGELTVYYVVSGTATMGSDFEPLAGFVSFVAGQTAATVRVVPIDDDLVEGNESVVLTLVADNAYQVGAPFEATVVIIDSDTSAVDHEPVSQTTLMGSVVSGSLSSVLVDDDIYLQIREESWAGGSKTRLEHRWTFQLSGSGAVAFHVQAHHTGENFQFAYSTNGGSSWVNMMTITKTADDNNYQVFAMPTNLTGTVLVRVVDLNRSKGDSFMDSIFVDDMFIRVGE